MYESVFEAWQWGATLEPIVTRLTSTKRKRGKSIFERGLSLLLVANRVEVYIELLGIHGRKCRIASGVNSKPFEEQASSFRPAVASPASPWILMCTPHLRDTRRVVALIGRPLAIDLHSRHDVAFHNESLTNTDRQHPSCFSRISARNRRSLSRTRSSRDIYRVSQQLHSIPSELTRARAW